MEYVDSADADPLHGYDPSQIVVGPGGQTPAQAARAETADLIARAASVLRSPQHPEHLEHARVLVAGAANLDDMWDAHQAAGHASEVWVLAALAWYLRASQR